MAAHARSARETLRLPDQPDGPRAAPWSVFDADWYRKKYPDAADRPDAELLEWHLTNGQRRGHSPNRYFDEEWQRHAWAGILDLIEAGSVASAFDAWCRGPNATRAPHWLFDPREYRLRYPALTDEALEQSGFLNRYHHYLSFGAAEGRIGHALFDPAVYLAALEPDAAAMPYRHYLGGLETGAPECRTSLLFDPFWYRDHYPEAARSVASGQYRSALEHYLCNDRPTEFDPSPWFSEAWYLARNSGLADAIGPTGFRNGFAHFLAHGLREGRAPHPDLDLGWYASRDTVRADIEAGRATDAYIHWITIGHAAGLPGRVPPEIPLPMPQALELYRRRAETIAPLFGRHKLDFSPRGTPAISAIVALSDQFAETMTSLAALRAQYHGPIELILIGSDAAAAEPDLESHVTGATVLRFGTSLTAAAVREAGLICATAEAVLLLAGGVELAPGAVDSALARLGTDPAIGAVGGRLVRPDGMLAEAGGIVWADGQLSAYARDASPLAAEANFARDVDFCATTFLLARRPVLAALSEQAAGIAGTSHDAADLCLRIRQAGFRVVYEPDAVALLTTEAPAGQPDGRAAFVAAHCAALARQPRHDPAQVIDARFASHGQKRILFIEDSIPLRRIGSGFVRSNDVLRAMAAAGTAVTVVPMKESHFPLSAVRAELPDTVEVMHQLTAADFADFIAVRRDYYDLIWIARTHNLDRLHQVLSGLLGESAAAAPALSGEPVADAATNVVALSETARWDRDLGGETSSAEPAPRSPRIIVDTEAVASVRQAAHAVVLGQAFDLDAALREEFRHLDPAMHVVAVTEAEAAVLRPYHHGPVSVLGHAIAASPTPRRFEERAGILFVGAIHGMEQPNYEGLGWFIDEVLPLIEQTLRWETRLTVAGYTAPGVSLERFQGHPRVTLRGPATDLGLLYDTHRVFVAPARFAAGIPYKVHEAAAFGVPVVATALLARQLGWPDGVCIGAAEATDPAGFAARVVALHRDAPLWGRIREAALARVTAELDPAGFAAEVARLAEFGGKRRAGSGIDENTT